MIEPDLDGFREASATLREKLGRDVIFYTFEEPTYDPSVQLDPETNRPYDPEIEPMASGVASAGVRAGLIYRPAGASVDVEDTAIGRLEAGQAILSLDPDVYEDENLDAADEVEMLNERYEIESADYDATGNGPPHRVLVKIRQK